MNLTEPIRAQASRAPDAPAYERTKRGRYDYRRYDALIDAIAWRVLEAGVAPGQRVGLLVERDFAFFTILLALARAGIASIRPESPDEACDAFIVPQGGGHPSSARTLEVDPAWFEPPSRARPAPMHPGGDAECHRFRTSGTTGRPKIVAMTHADLVARVERRLGAMTLPHPLRLLPKVRARAAYGFQVALATLWRGGTVIEPVEVGEVPATIERHGVTWLVTPPGVLAPLIMELPADHAPVPTLGLLEVSGSVLSEHLARLAATRVCPNVCVLYGSTEAGVVAQAPVAELKGVKDAVGRVVAGVDVEIVDERGTPLPFGQDGFLRIRSPGGARRYEGDDAPTHPFRDGWFYSGDVAMLTADGVLAVRGRADQRLNVGGAKIAPEEIEAVVQGFAGVADVAAFALRSASGIDRVGLAIVAGPAFDFEDCKARCRERLGIFTPEVVLRVAAIPRNENGKVERASLARLAAAHAPVPAAP